MQEVPMEILVDYRYRFIIGSSKVEPILGRGPYTN